MQDICRIVIEKWDEQGISMAEMVRRTQLGESTLRRFRAGDKGVTIHTLVTIAEAVGMSSEGVINMLSKNTATAKLMHDEFGCANTCPVRTAVAETLNATTALYERSLVEKNGRIRRFRIVTISLLCLFVAVVGFTFYLIFYDFPNPSKGILQYLTVEQVLEYLDEAGHLTR